MGCWREGGREGGSVARVIFLKVRGEKRKIKMGGFVSNKTDSLPLYNRVRWRGRVTETNVFLSVSFPTAFSTSIFSTNSPLFFLYFPIHFLLFPYFIPFSLPLTLISFLPFLMFFSSFPFPLFSLPVLYLSSLYHHFSYLSIYLPSPFLTFP